MRAAALLLLLAPAWSLAQLRLLVAPPGGTEDPVGAVHDLGQTYVGDTATARFRIRNTGTGPTTLSTLRVSGSGFTMTGAPSLPHSVAPGSNVDFTISFRPQVAAQYSANLEVNNLMVIVRATSIPAAVLYSDNEPLNNGSSVDFGRVERGSEQIVSFELRNTGRVAVALRSLEVSGRSFGFASENPAPRSLEPGESATFAVRFAPDSNQLLYGTLTIDGVRTVRLTGTGLEPRLPRPVITLETPVLRSGEQGRVSVRFGTPSRAQGRGTVQLEVVPSRAAKDNDSAAQFVTGGRVAQFDVIEGSADVRFGGQADSSIVFQAGTTAGTLILTVQAGGYTEQVSTIIAPEPVRLEKASAARKGASIDVQLTGFDNTRTAGSMTFTFYGTSGQPLAGGTLQVAAAPDFTRWFGISTLGGIFDFKASFPVTGDITLIRAVEVVLENAAGTARTDRLAF